MHHFVYGHNCLTLLPGPSINKTFFQRKRHNKFRGMTSVLFKKQNGGRLRNSIGFRLVLMFSMLFSAIFSMESLKPEDQWSCKRSPVILA